MRYMLLIYNRETDAAPEPSAAELEAVWALIEEASRKGVLVAAEPLADTATATTVRVRDGKPLITDGPFAETKEQLAGYFVLDCRDLDEAIEWAARMPNCKGGDRSVEIRPMPGLPPRPGAHG